MNHKLRIRCAMLSFLCCLCFLSTFSQSSFTIQGYVRDGSNGEFLINASVADLKSKKGVITNNYGFFSLRLPADSVYLTIAYAGFQVQQYRFLLNQDTTIKINLSPYSLDEVEILAEEVEREVDNTQMSAINVPIQQVKLMPALLGEVDVIKAIQMLPGVQSGSEGSSGLYVRGGGPDQNLVLLDGVPLYYVSHLGGFFSVFNADALSSVKLYKGGFPARFGGRLSSILDVRMKEGNLNQFETEGSIGIISSKISVQGPINKGKTAFIISGRRSYLDLLSRPIAIIASQASTNGTERVDVGYNFYDLNGKINHVFSDKDRLYLSMYAGNDRLLANGRFRYDQDEEEKFSLGLGWGNRMGALRWNHVYGNNLFSNVSATFSQYQLRTKTDGSASFPEGDSIYTESFELEYISRVRDWGLKVDFDYYPSPAHDIKFGLHSTLHRFEPGTVGIQSQAGTAKVDTNIIAKLDRPLESSIYLEDNIKIGQRFSANVGVHGTHYLINDQSTFSVQPRVSARFLLSKDVAVKASYVQMNQFLHLLTNSGAGLPIDLWVPATEKVPSQFAWQVAGGVSASILDDQLDLSVEGYYKEMTGLVTFKEGNNFFFGGLDGGSWEETVETDGTGTTYGAEFLLQKKRGKTTGWLGYTLAWNWRQFDNINGGLRYPYKYDRRHDISLVVSHKISDRVSVAGTWVFGTGNAISLPSGGYANITDPLNPDIYFFGGRGTPNEDLYLPFRQLHVDLQSYGEGSQFFNEGRNSFRMQSYHRMDLGINFTKEKKWGERTWTFGIYNVYSRRNPFAYYLDQDRERNGNVFNGYTERKPVLKKIALFPIIPSFSYQFKFKHK
ncbi:MAG: TonB-dependent receptor plug domain-containing protein [Bacteroidota bacterium]